MNFVRKTSILLNFVRRTYRFQLEDIKSKVEAINVASKQPQTSDLTSYLKFVAQIHMVCLDFWPSTDRKKNVYLY